MRIQIIAVGQKMPDWVEQAYQDYARRLPRHQPIVLSCIGLANRKSGSPLLRLQQQEAEKIQQKIKPGSLVIALDEHGKQWSTSEWAVQYRQWLQSYPQVNFIIGGPDGLAPELLSKADKTIALAKMTLPHGLVRVVLIEQIYRAWSVVEGHPYHRE
jgi:23S rRNA (pseudouridine1915-N3)-methyltransferase